MSKRQFATRKLGTAPWSSTPRQNRLYQWLGAPEGATGYFDFTSLSRLPNNITFTRASSAQDYNDPSLTFGTNVPVLTPSGLLLQGARSNITQRSEEIDNAYWNKTASSITANTIVAPNGTITADKLVEDATSATHQFSRINLQTVNAGEVWTASVYVKAAERNRVRVEIGHTGNAYRALFDLTSGGSVVGVDPVGVVGVIQDAGNGWFRCQIRATMSGGTLPSQIFYGIAVGNGASTVTAMGYLGDGTSGIQVWGTQLEQGSFASSYIPTTGTAQTRAADVDTAPPASVGWNATQNTTKVRFNLIGVSGTQPIFQVDDGTDNNRIAIIVVSGTLFARATVGGVDVANLNLGTVSAFTDYVVAFSAIQNAFYASVNSGAPQSDLAGNMPIGATTVRIGRDATGNVIFGYSKLIAVYPTAYGTAVQGLAA